VALRARPRPAPADRMSALRNGLACLLVAYRQHPAGRAGRGLAHATPSALLEQKVSGKEGEGRRYETRWQARLLRSAGILPAGAGRGLAHSATLTPAQKVSGKEMGGRAAVRNKAPRATSKKRRLSNRRSKGYQTIDQTHSRSL
jgi:hypothetical protein